MPLSFIVCVYDFMGQLMSYTMTEQIGMNVLVNDEWLPSILKC